MRTPDNGTLICIRLLRVAFPTLLASAFAIALSSNSIIAAAARNEARVTVVIREVKLLPEDEKPRPAEVNDTVDEQTAVRTGNAARSELTFPDLTITRLGANTIYSFGNSGRSVQLNSGAILLRVPKNTGGAEMRTQACTVGISGTTVILETTRAGQNSLAVLEGGARMSLNNYPNESAYVRGGQVLVVPAGAKKMPKPHNIDIRKVMKKHPLITDFPPLPNEDEIYAGTNQPSGPVYQGQPVNTGPAGGGPAPGGGPVLGGGPSSGRGPPLTPLQPLPNPGGGGLYPVHPPINTPGGGGTPKPKKPKKPHHGATPNEGHTPFPGNPEGGGNGGKSGKGKAGRVYPNRVQKAIGQPAGGKAKASPTPTPSKRKKLNAPGGTP